MAIRIKVSKSGYTRCPSCQSHIRVAARAATTTCDFCGATLGRALREDPSGPTALRGLAQGSRSGVLAMALLGAACGTEESASGAGGDAEVGVDAASDGGAVTDAAPGADAAADDTGGSDTVSDVNEADAPPVPPYGFPGDVEDDIEPDVVEDAGPMPEYGAPPEPDAGADVETDVVEDAGPMPEYGAPPEPDAGEEEEDASQDTADADNVPAPLYGAPP